MKKFLIALSMTGILFATISGCKQEPIDNTNEYIKKTYEFIDTIPDSERKGALNWYKQYLEMSVIARNANEANQAIKDENTLLKEKLDSKEKEYNECMVGQVDLARRVEHFMYNNMIFVGVISVIALLAFILFVYWKKGFPGVSIAKDAASGTKDLIVKVLTKK